MRRDRSIGRVAMQSIVSLSLMMMIKYFPRFLSLGLAISALCLGTQGRAEPLDSAPEGSFSIVVIPDTQGYFGAGTKRSPQSSDPVTNSALANHVRWIRENVTAQNIVFVSHVGDIVEYNRPEEWAVAQQHLDQLRGVVPFGLVVGNHDMEADGDSALFQRSFPAGSFATFDWYGGSYLPQGEAEKQYGDNVNSFQLFEAAGMEFVILHLECNAPDPVLAWAGQVLTQYQDRRALITTHMDLGIRAKPTTKEGFISDPKGRMNWTKNHGERGNTANQMWQKLYRHHANLGFIFSGDQSRVTSLQRSERGDHGNQVHALLSDYMSMGALRIYRFLPGENRVQVITYDTTEERLVEEMPHVPAREAHQFDLEYLMD